MAGTIYTLYFTYGSNMNEAQMAIRCPSSFFLCRARLPDHRFIITSRGYASVLEAPGCTVHGVLCAVTGPDERALDRWEEVRRNYYRRETRMVVTELGHSIPALIYIDNLVDEGAPRSDYLEGVLDGARRHGLPPEVIEEIGNWAQFQGKKG